jgi:hypothetical protein
MKTNNSNEFYELYDRLDSMIENMEYNDDIVIYKIIKKLII